MAIGTPWAVSHLRTLTLRQSSPHTHTYLLYADFQFYCGKGTHKEGDRTKMLDLPAAAAKSAGSKPMCRQVRELGVRRRAHLEDGSQDWRGGEYTEDWRAALELAKSGEPQCCSHGTGSHGLIRAGIKATMWTGRGMVRGWQVPWVQVEAHGSAYLGNLTPSPQSAGNHGEWVARKCHRHGSARGTPGPCSWSPEYF